MRSRDACVGDEAQSKCGVMRFSWPMQKGIITDCQSTTTRNTLQANGGGLSDSATRLACVFAFKGEDAARMVRVHALARPLAWSSTPVIPPRT